MQIRKQTFLGRALGIKPVKERGSKQNWVEREVELKGIINRSHSRSEDSMTLRCLIWGERVRSVRPFIDKSPDTGCLGKEVWPSVRQRSSTEVILEAWDEWGLPAPGRINSSFLKGELGCPMSKYHTVIFGGPFFDHCHFLNESLSTSLHITQICVLTSLVLKPFGISKNVIT